MIGKTIGHYIVEEKLGEGGMGVVYKATDTKLDRTVALKFLPDHVASGSTELERFIMEARAAAGLSHPNICTIHGIEEAEKKHFIVMEFVDGQTLQEKKSSLSAKEALDVGIQIAEGLAAAHEKGIVHRDIKPENIMFRRDGRVQIMDFGLAKLRGASRLTKEGSTVGTAGYMSPEQVQGKDTDHRSDIFSLGVLLYEMLTGQLPFKGVHETAIAYEIVNVDAAPMAVVKPEITPELDAIILECLEKDPRERTQSASQIAVDLKRYRRESSRQKASRITAARPVYAGTGSAGNAPVHASGPARASLFQRSAPAVSVIGILASVLFLILWAPWKGEERSTAGVTRTVVELEPGYVFSPSDGIPNLAISQDSRLLAYGAVNQETGESAIFVRPMDNFESRKLLTVDPEGLAFSADGEWLYYYSRSLLNKISVNGGAPVRVLTADSPRGLSIMPDGTLYLVPSLNEGIVRIRPGGDSTETLTTPDMNAGEISHRFPSVLPGENALIGTVKFATTASFDDASIFLFDLMTGERRTLVEGGTTGMYVPTGHIVYLRGGSIFAVPFDASGLETTGPPRRLFPGGQLRRDSGVALLSFARNGTLVFAPGGPIPDQQSVVDWLAMDGRLTSIIETPGAFGEIALSPDASKLAFRMDAANNDIWTYDLRRKTLQRLTFGGGNHGSAVWAPDGRRVAYGAEREGKKWVYWRPWDGSGKESLLVGEEGYDHFPAGFSPDGKYVLYYRGDRGRYDIWAARVDSPSVAWPVVQTQFEEQDAALSPTGRWVAYTSPESGTMETYIVPFPRGEGRWQITNDGVVRNFWNKDGSELIYVTRERSVKGVPVKDGPSPDPGTPRLLGDRGSAKLNIVSAGYDPVGERWAIIRQVSGVSMPSTINVVTGWFDELNRMNQERGE